MVSLIMESNYIFFALFLSCSDKFRATDFSGIFNMYMIVFVTFAGTLLMLTASHGTSTLNSQLEQISNGYNSQQNNDEVFRKLIDQSSNPHVSNHERKLQETEDTKETKDEATSQSSPASWDCKAHGGKHEACDCEKKEGKETNHFGEDYYSCGSALEGTCIFL